MIITFGGIKGGSGKTTLATNIAVCFATKKKTLLIDADEQKSASDWANQRECLKKDFDLTTISLVGNRIHNQIYKLKQDYDVIIIDAGGRDNVSQRSALTISDKFIVPFKPRSFDVWTLASLKQLICDIEPVNDKLKSYYVLNQADSRGKDNEDAFEILKESGILPLKSMLIHRKAYANAASEGLGVIELKDKDKKAIEEIVQLYKEICNDN